MRYETTRRQQGTTTGIELPGELTAVLGAGRFAAYVPGVLGATDVARARRSTAIVESLT